jgi:hypothetical protein
MLLSQPELVIELDGELHQLKGTTLTPLMDSREIEGGAALLFTDFQDSLSRVMLVETEAKYAEMLVWKQLREMGEIEESAHIITHWKKKRAKGSSELFFTALPTTIYHQYVTQVANHNHSLLLFPLYEALWHVLRDSASGSDPVAVLFGHGRYVEVLVGTSSQIYSVTRMTAYAPDEMSMLTLWDSLQQELLTVSREKHIQLSKLVGFHWLQDNTQFHNAIQNLASELDIKAQELPVETYHLGEKEYQSSLPGVLQKVSAARAALPQADIVRYFSNRIAPWVTAVLLLFSVGLGATGLLLSWQGASIEEEANKLQQEINRQSSAIPKPPDSFKPLLSFAEELRDVRNTPSYRTIINEISETVPVGVTVHSLSIERQEGQLQVQLVGWVDATFHQAQGAHQRFLNALRRLGYQIMDQQFTTNIDASSFMLNMQREIEND